MIESIGKHLARDARSRIGCTGSRPVRHRIASVRDTSPGFQPFGFQGGLYDPDTGLVEFGCRWYDAETGRWISKDPILLEGGWNVYAFCGGDPENNVDPMGTFVVAIGGGGAAGAGSAVAGDSGLVFGLSVKKGFQWGTYQPGAIGFHIGADASFGLVGTVAPFADDIADISGLSQSTGGSLGIGPSLTGEFAIPIGDSPKGTAISISGGAGVGAEGHSVTTFTMVQERTVRDEYYNFKDGITASFRSLCRKFALGGGK